MPFRRAGILTLMASTALFAENLKVDHATVAGDDLARMRDEFAHSGLASEYGGDHPNHATNMAIISFADGSYLELISKQTGADPKSFAAHAWSKFITANAGPCAWAIRPADLQSEVKRLRAANVTVEDPQKGGRDRPDGLHLDWETAQVHGDRGSFYPFMIRDVTPRENRVYPTGKPSAPEFEGVSKVIIAVKDLDAAIAHYRLAFSLPAPRRSVDEDLDATLASFDDTPVVLAAARKHDNWIAARVELYPDAPCAFVIRSKNSAAPGHIRWLSLKSVQGRIGIE